MTSTKEPKTMNHTPTPWKLDSTKIQSQQWALGGIAIKSYRKDYDEYCAFNQLKGVKLDEDMANAKFIVTACNSHEDLVKALKSACVAMSFKYGFDGDKDLGAMEIDKKYGSSLGSVYLEMREALAKAGITL